MKTQTPQILRPIYVTTCLNQPNGSFGTVSRLKRDLIERCTRSRAKNNEQRVPLENVDPTRVASFRESAGLQVSG